MALINSNFNLSAPKPLDYRYGPWESVAHANSGITSNQRYVGLTVGVMEGTLSGSTSGGWSEASSGVT